MIVLHSPFLLCTELKDYISMSPLLCYCCGVCTIRLIPVATARVLFCLDTYYTGEVAKS